MVEVRTVDRTGLLYALGRALAAERLSIRSAHISTLAGQAIDTFYVTEADGRRPDAARAQVAVGTLAAAAGSGRLTTEVRSDGGQAQTRSCPLGKPPLEYSSCPLIQRPRSDSRKRTKLAVSTGVPS